MFFTLIKICYIDIVVGKIRKRKNMFGEKDLSNQYVVLLLSTLLLLVLGSLIIEFDILDFGYLVLAFVTAIRYVKIKLEKE